MTSSIDLRICIAESTHSATMSLENENRHFRKLMVKSRSEGKRSNNINNTWSRRRRRLRFVRWRLRRLSSVIGWRVTNVRRSHCVCVVCGFAVERERDGGERKLEGVWEEHLQSWHLLVFSLSAVKTASSFYSLYLLTIL